MRCRLFRFLVVSILVLYFLSTRAMAQGLMQFGFFLESGNGKVSIPFELHNNLIIITCRFNNMLPLKLVLDTGVKSPILLNKGLADVLGISMSKSITVMGVGYKQVVEAFIGHNVSLDFVTTRANKKVYGRGVSILVLKEDYLQLANHIGKDIHGVIGFDIFSRFTVEIDYSSKVINLYESGKFKPKRGYHRLDLEILDTKPHVTIPVKINDTITDTVRLMVDTGASHALLLHNDENDNIYLPEKKIRAHLGRGISGEISGYIGRVPEMKIGPFVFNDIVTSFPDQSAYGDSLTTDNRSGTIGGLLLKKFKVVFQYYDGAIYFKKASGFKKPFEYNMSGIDLKTEGDEFQDLVVTNIREGSVAYESGIKEGDIIKSINGISSGDLSLSLAYRIFTSKEGRKINLVLKRDNKIIKETFKLRREI